MEVLQQHSNLPVSEVYWSLVKKTDKKFSKIRDLPYYQRNRSLSGFSLMFVFFVCVIRCLMITEDRFFPASINELNANYL